MILMVIGMMMVEKWWYKEGLKEICRKDSNLRANSGLQLLSVAPGGVPVAAYFPIPSNTTPYYQCQYYPIPSNTTSYYQYQYYPKLSNHPILSYTTLYYYPVSIAPVFILIIRWSAFGFRFTSDWDAWLVHGWLPICKRNIILSSLMGGNMQIEYLELTPGQQRLWRTKRTGALPGRNGGILRSSHIRFNLTSAALWHIMTY